MMYETRLKEPAKAIAFPDSNYWNPTEGEIIGREHNPDFGSFRYIFRYKTNPTRKITGQIGTWPNGLLYLVERDVEIIDKTNILI